jgi:hypothetical protein
MMTKKLTFGAGLMALLFAGVSVAQTQQVLSGDYRNAAAAEIRNAQGDVLLKGTFAPADTDDDGEVERLAKLTPASAATGLAGEAEVEYQKDDPNVLVVEFLVTGAPAGAVLTLFVDGKSVMSATADDKGRAEAEVNIRAARP